MKAPIIGGLGAKRFTNHLGLLYHVQVISYNWCWVTLPFTQPTFYLVLGCASLHPTYFLLGVGLRFPSPNLLFTWCWVTLPFTQPTFYCSISSIALGTPALKTSLPSGVTKTSSSILTPIPRHRSGNSGCPSTGFA